MISYQESYLSAKAFIDYYWHLAEMGEDPTVDDDMFYPIARDYVRLYEHHKQDRDNSKSS